MLKAAFHREAAAEAEAWRLQELHGQQREVKAVSTLSALPVFEPKVPYGGVTWSQAEQQWRAGCSVCGVIPQFQGEAQGSLGGRTGAFLPSGQWLGRRDRKKEKEKMAKSKAKQSPRRSGASATATSLELEISKASQELTSQVSSCKMITHSCQNAGKQADPSCPCKAIHLMFHEVSS